MLVRLVARDEPYASYRPEMMERDSCESLSFFICARDEAAPYRDATVLPVDDFLGLPEPRRRGSIHIAYGSVSRIGDAFAADCSDYLRDPWSIQELRARLRRFAEPRFEIGKVRFTLRGHELVGPGGAAVPLTEHERRILGLLSRRGDETIDRSVLIQAIGREASAGSRSLDVHIGRIRKKLSGLSPEAGSSICAVRGLGYRLLCRTCG